MSNIYVSPQRNAVSKNKYGSYIPLVLRLFIGIMWVYAGIVKIQGNFLDFLSSIQAYDIFPTSLSIIITQTLPIVEVILGIVILVGIKPKIFGIVSVTLLTLFIIGLSQALLRGLVIDCGCFGTGGNSSKTDMIVAIIRNTIFITLSLLFAMSNNRKWCLYP